MILALRAGCLDTVAGSARQLFLTCWLNLCYNLMPVFWFLKKNLELLSSSFLSGCLVSEYQLYHSTHNPIIVTLAVWKDSVANALELVELMAKLPAQNLA